MDHSGRKLACTNFEEHFFEEHFFEEHFFEKPLNTTGSHSTLSIECIAWRSPWCIYLVTHDPTTTTTSRNNYWTLS
jgi:hypothetical protein